MKVRSTLGTVALLGGRRPRLAKSARLGDTRQIAEPVAMEDDEAPTILTVTSLAGEPLDERWIGDDPPAHGPRAKVSAIC